MNERIDTVIEIGDLVRKIPVKNTRSSNVNIYGVCQQYDSQLKSTCIAWHPCGKLSEEKLSNVQTIDRPFVPGEYVRCIKSGKIGYIQNVSKFTAVEIKDKDKDVVMNVDSKRLKHPKLYLDEQDFILFKNVKMGVVVKAYHRIRLSYIPEKQRNETFFVKMDEVWIDWDLLASYIAKDAEDPFFRHNLFYVGLDLDKLKWIEFKETPVSSMTISEFLSAKIAQIEINKLKIQWVNTDESIVLEEELMGKDLKNIRRLNLFDYTKVYVGSIRMLRLKRTDFMVTKKEWDLKKEQSPPKRKQKSPSKLSVVPVEVLCTVTSLQLIFLDDGSEMTTESYNVTRHDEKIKLYPGVTVRYENAERLPSEGIIKTIDLLNKTVTVNTSSLKKNDEVSLYDIKDVLQSLVTGSVIIYDRNWNNWDVSEPNVMMGYVLYTKKDGNVVTILDNGDEYLILMNDQSIVYHSTICNFKNRDAYPQPKITKPACPVVGNDNWPEFIEWIWDEYFECVGHERNLEFITKVPLDNPFRNIRPIYNAQLKTRMMEEIRCFDPNERQDIGKIRIKAFVPRADLYSVMIVGPKRTPYFDFLFFFDVFLPPHYPSVPPKISYRAVQPFGLINPLLLPDGTVNIPMIQKQGWTRKNMLKDVFNFIIQYVLISIPCLLNQFNGQRLTGTEIMLKLLHYPSDFQNRIFDQAKVHNEAVMLNLFKMAYYMIKTPVPLWENQIRQHFETEETKEYFSQLMNNVNDITEESKANKDDWIYLGGFPILPLTKGGRISLTKWSQNFLQCL